ncbi:hypothetical protein CAEBREN_02121 [Caenorhabditis brenneri]|uniref:Uncharacterized protein n=1 Tax=Caenorhabditis brenneri TaxID=135651 RepID=G0M8Q9_CAEBE|nr:hypothetical protein CAEBREN_02121 [Caenorhabditis brenneri]
MDRKCECFFGTPWKSGKENRNGEKMFTSLKLQKKLRF